MKQISWIVLGWITLLMTAHASEMSPLASGTVPTSATSDDSNIPKRGKTLQSFVPPGYEIGIEVDANLMAMEEMILRRYFGHHQTQPRSAL